MQRANEYHPALVAHRGLTEGGLIENTVESISAAIEAGLAAVEFDVRRTGDGAWIVHHDATLERIHGIDRAISHLSLEELQELAPVAALEDVLPLFPRGCVPMVEVKEPEPVAVNALATMLEKNSLSQRAIVIARGPEMPAALINATTKTDVYLYSPNWQEALDRADEGMAGYDLCHIVPDAALVERCLPEFRSRNQAVAVWTVNSTSEARRWLKAGANWVITDRPSELSNELRSSPDHRY